MSSLLLILLLFVFFVMAGFFSLAETAIFSSNRYRLKHMASSGNRRAAQITSWLDAPDALLATILLGNNFANIASATLSATLVSHWIADQDLLEIALIAEAALLTLFVLMFCELGPKALAARYPERIALSVVIPVELCMKALSPLTRSGIKVTGLFFRHVKAGETVPQGEGATGDELRAMISGAGEREDRVKMLERVLEFSERPVKDVMVPRPEVTALEMGTSFEDLRRIVETTRYTRYPVYQGTFDNVIGILHGKDLMPWLPSPRNFRLSQLLRRPVFIPDTVKMDNAIRLLQSAQTHMGIVVDEHGGVEGVVTVEDLIEQIVGEIQDEHDVEVDSLVLHADGSSLIDASISVRELNARLQLEIPESGQYVTLAGFLLRQAGRLLKEGEELEWNRHRFQVDHVVARRIMRVRFVPAVPDHPAEAAPVSQKSSGMSS